MSQGYTKIALEVELNPGDQEYLQNLLNDPDSWIEDPEDGLGFYPILTETDLYIADSEYVNLENVAELLMQYMRDRRPGEVCSFEYAFTHSKLTPGEFGGGCCVIDSYENVVWRNTGRMSQRLEYCLSPRKMTLFSASHNIQVEVTPDKNGGSASITSNLTGREMDGLTSLILAHAAQGVDIEDFDYLKGVESAIQAISNNAPDEEDNPALVAARDAYQWLSDLLGEELDEEGQERLRGIADLIDEAEK